MKNSAAHMELPGLSSGSTPELSCISFDHKSADLALLERIERHTDALTAALAGEFGGPPGGAPGTGQDRPDRGDSRGERSGTVVLATCNRFEVYFDASSAAPERALEQVAQLTGIPADELAAAARVHRGVDAARHLFEVSSGLESMVVGEGEISGQVGRALVAAQATGVTTALLEQLFQKAASVSKSVKQRTRVQTRGRSLVRLALFLAESRVGDWSGTRVLLVGTGAYAAVTLAALRERGVTEIAVYSPSGRAATFAETREVRPVGADALETELAAADIVIACSNAQDPLLDVQLIARTVTPAARPYCTAYIGRAPGGLTRPPRAATPPRPRLLFDLGMPRNIAPAAADISGVELLDLELVARHAGVEELSAEAEARKIADDAALEFAASRAEREAIPSVQALHAHVNALLTEELDRHRGAPDFATVIEPALRHFAGRLLHQPTLRIRELGRAGQAADAAAAVRTLFPAKVATADPDQFAA